MITERLDLPIRTTVHLGHLVSTAKLCAESRYGVHFIFFSIFLMSTVGLALFISVCQGLSYSLIIHILSA